MGLSVKAEKPATDQVQKAYAMKQPINPGRLILATLFSPFIGGLFVFVLLTIFDQGVFDDPLGYLEFLGTVVGVGTLLIGWPTMLMVGLPLHGWLCHKDQRHWARYAGFGAIGGVVPTLAFGLFEGGGNIPLLLVGLGAGSVTAVLFHIIRGPHLPLTEPTNLPT
jgi:hypothetical protein